MFLRSHSRNTIPTNQSNGLTQESAEEAKRNSELITAPVLLSTAQLL